MVVFAVGGDVGVGTLWVAEVVTGRVGPEGGVNDFEVGFGDGGGVVTVVFIEALLEGVVHGIDGGLAGFVATHGV